MSWNDEYNLNILEMKFQQGNMERYQSLQLQIILDLFVENIYNNGIQDIFVSEVAQNELNSEDKDKCEGILNNEVC